MKVLITVLVVTSEICKGFKLTDEIFGCGKQIFPHTYLQYHIDLQRFSTKLLQQVAKSNDHFALSQYSIWLSLSGIAESADGEMQRKLFEALSLPHDRCYREKYYEIATSLESPGNDVYLTRNRTLILDDELEVNRDWMIEIRELGLVNTISEPIRSAETTNRIRDIIGGNITVNITTNAVLIDSLYYHGFWTTAFSGNTTAKEDFFNDNGVKIGAVDMLKMRRRVKFAYIPLLNIKILELPAGNNGRYRILFLMNVGRSPVKATIDSFSSTLLVDIMPLLIETIAPIEIAIPKFEVTTQMDLKKSLEAIGLEDVWKEGTSKRISEPPATPSTLLQRVTVKMDRQGLQAAPSTGWTDEVTTGIAGAMGRQFIANRPFIYGLIDSQTRTWLFSGVFSRPS